MEHTQDAHSSQDSGSHEGSGSREGSRIEKTFRKGRWTAEEDELLIAYVNKHGEKKWNNVEKYSGLSRCSKSCRFRWLNYLRPGLKKGPFTEEEEKLVTELYKTNGPKWALMAAHIQGRTDNEIKNFWHTRTKNRKRKGLHIYPPELQEQAMNSAAQISRNRDSSNAHHSQESMGSNSLVIRDVGCEYLQPNQCPSYYRSMPHNFSTGNIMRQRRHVFQPNIDNFLASPNMPNRNLEYFQPNQAPSAEYESMLHNISIDNTMIERPRLFQPDMNNFLASPNMPNHNHYMRQIPRLVQPGTNNLLASPNMPSRGGYSEPETVLPFMDSYGMNNQNAQPSNILPENHSIGNASYSSIFGPSIHEAENLELPSFQCFDRMNLGTQDSNQIPTLESSNTLIMSPPIDQTPSHFPSSSYDGLLESVVYGSSPEIQATHIDSESSLIGQTEFAPAGINTTNLFDFGSTSPNERQAIFNGDWIEYLLGEDMNNTK